MLDFDLADMYEVDARYDKQFADVYDAKRFLLQKVKF